MLSPRSDEFLKEILSYVKFIFDRNDIRTELESHITDKMEYYLEQGYDHERAEELSIRDMGDARVIGRELNKQHSWIIGWIWEITNVATVLIIVVFCYIFIFTIGSLFPDNLIKDMPKENIVYRIDLKKKVKIDDRVIRFTNVIYDKAGNMNIYYEYYDTRLWGSGWGLGYLGEISDNLGHTYIAGSGQENSGIVKKGVWSVHEFSGEADTLIISYDRYNRAYKVEIPLKAGEYNE